jgi:DNA-binding transcriptional LysR family regulator
MFSLKSLEMFYWAVNLKSFSRAAVKLNTTQPSISQRIAAMETLIGQPLFDRSVKPAGLTEKGHVLYAHAEILLLQMASMVNDLKLSHQYKGTIRLGVSETIVQTWLARFLEQAARHFPMIDIDITVDVTPSMTVALRTGELDMSLMLGPSMIDGFSSVKLTEYAMHFYAVPGLIDDNFFSKNSKSSTPIITYPKSTSTYSAARDIILKTMGRMPRIFGNSSISTIEKMAVDGLGVALVAEGCISAAGLAKLEIVGQDVEINPLQFYAYYQSGVRGDVFELLADIAVQAAT